MLINLAVLLAKFTHQLLPLTAQNGVLMVNTKKIRIVDFTSFKNLKEAFVVNMEDK
jgi:hypothetical protein